MTERAALVRKWAEAYVRWGWFIHPIYELGPDGSCSCGRGDKCGSPGKHPRLKKWQEQCSDQMETVNRWLEQWPQMNVGVVAGRSGVVCLDVDERNGGRDGLAEWERDHGKLPATIRAISGSGSPHFIFRRPGVPKLKSAPLGRNEQYSGIDVKADGGYFLVEPSNHLSGTDYRWDSEAHPEQTKLAELPQVVAHRMASDQVEESPAGGDVRAGIIGLAFSKIGRLGRSLGPGKAAAECPNEEQHTSGRRFDSSTVVFAPRPGSYLGYFHCSHSHCTHLNKKRNILGFLPFEAVEEAKRELQPTAGDPEWAAPLPIDMTGGLPDYPIHALPPELQDWVLAESEATQTPPDMPAMLALGALGAAAAKVQQVILNAGWREPLNLFVAVAMPPASRKSAVFRDATQPLREIEEEERQAVEGEIAKQSVMRELLEARAKKAKAAVTRSKDSLNLPELQQEAIELEIEARSVEVPAVPQRIADDITMEQLARSLAAQGGRLAVMSSEGGIFSILAGRYSDGRSNLDVFLKGHAGDHLTVNRVSGTQLSIPEPTLTVCLAVQPSIIQGLTAKPEFRGTGLLARFLYSMPESNIGKRKITTRAVPPDIQKSYKQLFSRIVRQEQRDLDGTLRTQSLFLDFEAQQVFGDYRAALEPRLGPGGDLREIEDWGGKLAGTVARLAAILCLADDRQEVKGIDIQRAIEMGEYLIKHAMAAFGTMGSDATSSHAKHLLEWVKLNATEGVFTKRDAHRMNRSVFKRATELDAPLQLLIELDWLKEITPIKRGPGRPSRSFRLNPAALNSDSVRVSRGRNGQ